VARCIEKGLVVHQGDIMEGLDQYATGAFDYVLLLGTFQELVDLEDTMTEAFRVGRKLLVAYNNFSYWRLRLAFMLRGQTPVTAFSQDSWYRSPNRHVFSIDDFQEFLSALKIKEIRSAYFNARGQVPFLPNLLADQVLSELSMPAIRAPEI
jgi:methionine biosynthesis protein MetW